VVDEQAAPEVRRCFALVREGKALRKVAGIMAEENWSCLDGIDYRRHRQA
jgi:hypothetical protein